MLIVIPNIFTKPQIRDLRAKLDAAEWVDGRVTAGHQSALAKNNSQIPENHPVAREVGELILGTLGSHPLFRSAALPLKGRSDLWANSAGVGVSGSIYLIELVWSAVEAAALGGFRRSLAGVLRSIVCLR
jgi:hypothetical protein